MGLKQFVQSTIWKTLPARAFHPKEGDVTTGGLYLTKNPSLETKDEIKFAVFSDMRFYIRHLCEKLIPFLPEDFEFIGVPNGQNCFKYALDIDPKTKQFGRKEFDTELVKREYATLMYSENNLQAGDLVVYSINAILNNIREHAAIYMGNGRVRSRLGENAPLIEHPLREVPSILWGKDDRYLAIEQKVGNGP